MRVRVVAERFLYEPRNLHYAWLRNPAHCHNLEIGRQLLMSAAGHSERTVQLIGGFKLAKGTLLIMTALGLFSILHKDQAALLSSIVHRFSVDPHGHYFSLFAERFLRLSPKLPLITVGTLCYGVVFILEGIGLVMRKRWGEYLTVIVTGSFLPLEIYEIAHHATVIKGFVIALNLAILIYLIVRLRTDRKTHSSVHKSRTIASERHRAKAVA